MNFDSENRTEDFDKKFSHGSIIGFALDFTCVARHSDQCSKLIVSCDIPTLPASKAFTTVPICENIENFRRSPI